MLDIAFDEPLGILRCVSSGVTSLAEVEAFGRKAVMLQGLSRARHGGCLILVDASETAVHTKEAAGYFADWAATRWRPGDRTAIVIASAIAKLQSQRITVKEATAYFTDEPAAIEWLLTAPSGS